MASGQFLRSMSPLLHNGCRLLPMARSAVHISKQTVTEQNHVLRLTTWRSMSSGEPQLEVLNIQDETDFKKRVIKETKPVVVDFHATWCGPCKLLGPRLETIIAGEKGKVVMAKVDIDENVELAMKYNVQSVPTVYGMKDGKIIQQFVGLKEDDELQTFVKSLL